MRDNIESFEELRFWEDFYIKLYNSTDNSIGYNMVPGGMNGGWNHSKEAVEKIIKRSNLPDNKALIRRIQKLAVVARKGTHHKKESKLQIVNSKFGKLKLIEIYNKEGKLLHTCNLSTEASELTGISRSAISNNLIGLSKSTKKYIFKYKDN